MAAAADPPPPHSPRSGSLLSRRRRQQSGGGGGGSGSGGSSTWQRRARPLPVTSGTHHRGGERGRGGSPGPAAAAPSRSDPLRASPPPARRLGAQPVPAGGGVRAPARGLGWGRGRGWGAASPPAGVCDAAVRGSGSWSRGSSGEKMEDARVWRWPAGHSWAASRDSDLVPSGVASLSYPQRQSELRLVTWLFSWSSSSKLPRTNYRMLTSFECPLPSGIFIPKTAKPSSLLL
uniref:homeotic protein ultrabithorax-like n=1 Tax=Arvicanthis niloticus TaxID=61156 RepID=UPI0014869FAF|nr:homeotic protein ultrabithorax-like [Arvicanthis niloticus]